MTIDIFKLIINFSTEFIKLFNKLIDKLYNCLYNVFIYLYSKIHIIYCCFFISKEIDINDIIKLYILTIYKIIDYRIENISYCPIKRRGAVFSLDSRIDNLLKLKPKDIFEEEFKLFNKYTDNLVKNDYNNTIVKNDYVIKTIDKFIQDYINLLKIYIVTAPINQICYDCNCTKKFKLQTITNIFIDKLNKNENNIYPHDCNQKFIMTFSDEIEVKTDLSDINIKIPDFRFYLNILLQKNIDKYILLDS